MKVPDRFAVFIAGMGTMLCLVELPRRFISKDAWIEFVNRGDDVPWWLMAIMLVFFLVCGAFCSKEVGHD